MGQGGADLVGAGSLVALCIVGVVTLPESFSGFASDRDRGGSASSAAFMAPIGTAPSPMVMAPGGYGFRHYLRVGGPLGVLFLAVGAAIIPSVWGF